MAATQSSTNKGLGKHAVVIGGSIGGLLAARVLSSRFECVTLVERDALPDAPGPRKGVPQGAHVHAIFGGGVRVIERLFPGFFEELTASGGCVYDFAKDLRWFHGGVWKLRTASDLTSYWQSRPFLEAHIRRRTKSDTTVRFLECCDVVRLLANAEKTRITGVEVEHRRGESGTERLEADLVVDAGGRGSRTPQWLEALGQAQPEECTVEINLGYASRIYERNDDTLRDWQILVDYATPPDHTRTGYVFPIEQGRWLVTLVGFFEDYPPDDDEGFLKFAESLENPDVFAAIKHAKPLTPISTLRFPMQRWRHYERLSHFPEGLLVLGDAICSFSPVYGQGMSTVALEVDLLDRMLQEQGAIGTFPPRFGRRYFKLAAKIIADPWLLATNADFLYPRTGGKRPFGTRLLNWYLVRVLRLCAWNRAILLRFYRVMHFIDKPRALFHPYVLFHVFRCALGLRGRRPNTLEQPKLPEQ